MRERLVLETPAAGEPFDHGIFVVIEEAAETEWPDGDGLRFRAESVRWEREARAKTVGLRVVG
jgi:hypothetical protein